MHRLPPLLWLVALSTLHSHFSSVLAGSVNVTVDDSAPSLTFSPTDSWFSSTNTSGCAFCLAPQDPSIAYKSTWHFGLHIIPTNDADDQPSTVVEANTGSGNKGGSGKDDDGDESSGDTDGDGDEGQSGGSDHSEKGKGHNSARESQPRRLRRFQRRRRSDVEDYSSYYAPTSTQAAAVTGISSPFFTQKFDSDDPGFVDTPVFMQFNFSGTAIYINCLLPLGVPPNTNSTPTLTNLTFTLDGQPISEFLHPGSAQSSGFQPNATVFSQTGLDSMQHTLRVDLGPDSVFLLDSVIFTQDSTPAANSTSGGVASAASDLAPSTAAADSSGSSNRATFGGVLGAVGFLATVALCTAGSIIRRRRRSAKRTAREREQHTDAESFHTFDGEDGDNSGPEMRGPEPFVPRFFPNTVPRNPPQYAPPEAITTEDSVDIPPPFAVAVASPEPPLLASIMRRPLEHLHPPASDGPSSAETSDMEELSTSSPLMVTYSPRRIRPPSFRSVASTNSPSPSSAAAGPPESQPPSSDDHNPMLASDVEDDHTSHENSR